MLPALGFYITKLSKPKRAGGQKGRGPKGPGAKRAGGQKGRGPKGPGAKRALGNADAKYERVKDGRKNWGNTGGRGSRPKIAETLEAGEADQKKGNIGY